MNEPVKGFGDSAVSLAHSPLGIIALFIVLIYGFASLMTVAGNFAPEERIILVYFLVGFPVLVFVVFAWLVTDHNAKLFGPSHFKNEENYLKMMQVVASLTAATAKGNSPTSDADFHKIVNSVRNMSPAASTVPDSWMNHVLWVDDVPDNNVYERRAFETVGLRFTLARSTEEAFERLSNLRFAAIISDMGRREGPREGYVLLDRLRAQGDHTPVFFYASSNDPEHKRETTEHGGQDCTNNAQELFEMVMRTIVSGQAAA